MKKILVVLGISAVLLMECFEVNSKPNISFDESLIIADAKFPTAGVMIKDFNGDGNLDIVLAKGRHWPAEDEIVYGNDQGGILKKMTLPDSNNRSYGGMAADLDLDGDLDFVIGNDDPDEKLIYFNDGNGESFSVKSFGDPNWNTRYCTIKDVNGDFAPDIILANRSDGEDSSVLLFNTWKNGKFGNFSIENSIRIGGIASTSIAVEDLNMDGNQDLIVPNRNGGQSYIFWGPDFQEKSPWGDANAQYRVVKISDINRDGYQDIITTSTNDGVLMFLKIAKGGFKKIKINVKSRPYSIAIGDLNRDGKPDIVVGNKGMQPFVLIQENFSRNRWQKVDFGDSAGAAYCVEIVDFNTDNVQDIVVGRSDADSRVYFGQISEDVM